MNWRAIPGYPGYEASSCGQVRSVDRVVPRNGSDKGITLKGKVLKSKLDKRGYPRLSLSLNNSKVQLRVHRAVALAFLENPTNLPQVNHIDGIKINNCVSNLEWISNQDNTIHAYANGLLVPKTGTQHAMFSGSVTAYDKAGNIVATMNGSLEMKKHGFDYRLVSACVLGKRKTHKQCTFKKEKL